MKRSVLRSIDWSLIMPVFILVALSLATLSSINVSYLKNQLLFLGIAIFAFFFFSQLNYAVLRFYALPIYIASILILVLILFFGVESRGAVRWFELLGISVQFSEILKPALIISLATYLSKHSLSLKTMVGLLILLFPLVFLIFLQPDFGNAVIYTLTLLLTLIGVGFPLLWFGTGFVLLTILFPLLWRLLQDYQKARLLSFLNPAKDPLGTSYNAIQSVIAVGSGMILGKGFSEATQSGLRFLPERHSDFIFATLSEGLGFVGAILVFGAFAYLLFRVYTIFLTTEDTFGKIIALSSFSLLLTHVFLNLGMNVGFVPVVGITLPFTSYGGSSLLSNFILLGLLSSITNRSSQREVLAIR